LAANAVTVRLTDATGPKGTNVTSYFTITNYTSLGIGSMTIGIFYDSAFLQYAGSTLGPVLNNTNEFFDVTDNGNGLLTVQYSDTEGAALPDSPSASAQKLFSVTFTVRNDAVLPSSPLNMQGLITPAAGNVLQFDSLALPPTAGIGTITVGPAPDIDGDGVPDTSDNCILLANANQRDTNGDGYGNLCDPDFNNNGVVDSQDGALLKVAFGSSAFPDRDLNGNGIVDSNDGARLKARFGQSPGPSGLVP